MKCIKCGSEWISKQDINKCSVCGNDFDSKEINNFSVTLSEIVANYGVNILNDKKLIAILRDYIPKEKKPIYLMEVFLKVGLGKELIQMYYDKNCDESTIIEYCTKKMFIDAYIDNNHAERIIYEIYKSLPKLNTRIDDYEKQSDMDCYKKESENLIQDACKSYINFKELNLLWTKNKIEITDEEYNNFYINTFHDHIKPVKTIHITIEGLVNYTALLFIPGRVPCNYNTKNHTKGLKFYASNFLIIENCPELLPDCFDFIKGIVDSPDFTQTVTAQTIQNSKRLKFIALILEKKIQRELLTMQKKERNIYKNFFLNFGMQLKYSLCKEPDLNKQKLQDLVMFYSSTEKELVTLSEYTSRMSSDQKYIYYAIGKSIDEISKLPQMKKFENSKYEVLYLIDDIDKLTIQTINIYKNKPFISILSEYLVVKIDESEEDIIKRLSRENMDLLEYMKTILNGKVREVCLTNRLTSFPSCISTKGEISINEKNEQNLIHTNQNVLEINVKHPIFHTLQDAYKEDRNRVKIYTEKLYDKAPIL